MSFLDNIQANKSGVINPFGAKSAPSKPATTIPKSPNATPKQGVPSKPAFAPPAKPGAAKPTTMPKSGASKPGAKPNATPKIIPVKEEVAVAPKVVQEEAVQEVLLEVMNEVAKETVKEVVEEPVKEVAEEKVTEPVEDNVETEKVEEEKPKSNKKSSSSRSKKQTQSKEEKVVDTIPTDISKEETELIDTLFKIPSTSVKYSDAIKHVTNSFVDSDWEEKKKALLEESDSIEIEADMQEGAMKKTIAKLSSLREKVWVNFIETKSLFESLSNKDVEGIIERIKFANLEGGNETARKKAGVLAVMQYKTPDGDTINLYELYDETKNRYYFLKGLMDTIAYKSNLLITMSSAIKIQKNM